MRVGFELTGLELDRAGVARAALGLQAVLAIRDDVELVPLSQSGRGGRVLRGLTRELAYLPLALPRRARRLGIELLHCTTQLVPLRPGLPLAITVHDVLAWTHPDWLARSNVLQQHLVLSRAAKRAAAVLAPSEYSRAAIAEHLAVDPSRIAVTPWGVDERFRPGSGSADSYVLTVGTLQPRKNLEAALSAFERGADSSEHRLVIVGARGWSADDLLARIERSPVRARIRLAGRVSDDELVALYQGAACFLFPSRYEGFGLPALEAMACGTPVVASSTTSLPEVVGDAGILLDPDDHDAWSGALSHLLGDAELRADLSRRGRRRAAAFTWSTCAERTVAAYREALS